MKTLVLDLDETLIFSSKIRIFKRKHLLKFDGYFVYERDGLIDFLDFCFENFKVVIWTASKEDYALKILSYILEGRDFKLFHRDDCDKITPVMGFTYYRKDLTKLGCLNNILVVDDNIKCFEDTPKNLIVVKSFFGGKDNELERVKKELIKSNMPTDNFYISNDVDVARILFSMGLKTNMGRCINDCHDRLLINVEKCLISPLHKQNEYTHQPYEKYNFDKRNRTFKKET